MKMRELQEQQQQQLRASTFKTAQSVNQTTKSKTNKQVERTQDKERDKQTVNQSIDQSIFTHHFRSFKCCACNIVNLLYIYINYMPIILVLLLTYNFSSS